MEKNQAVPAISVITIVKNNEELLPRAIDSVLSQTFTGFEHIIVNDGSTDRTAAIIDRYAVKDKRLLPKHLPQNVGRAMARNAGMAEAQGRYIFFLDSDDYLPETALMDLYEVAEEDNADIVFGRIKSFDQFTGNWLPRHYTDSIIDPERHGFCLDDNLNLVNDHSVIGRLYRHEMLQTNKISFSTVRKNGEDVLFTFFSIFSATELTTLPQKTVYFYNAGNYLTTANEPKLFDARDNVLETLNYAVKNGSDPLKRRMRRKAAMFAANLERVQKVYGNNEVKFLNYLRSLLPLIEGFPADILNGLPPYYKKFTNALLSNDFQGAYLAWMQQNISTAPGNKTISLEVEKLRRSNKELACQLDDLYHSSSWRITAPLRWAKKFVFRQKYRIGRS